MHEITKISGAEFRFIKVSEHKRFYLDLAAVEIGTICAGCVLLQNKFEFCFVLFWATL